MPSRDDRFAEIAVRKGFCSKEQMGACRTMQAQDPDPAALADILRFNGVLTDEQVAAVDSPWAFKPIWAILKPIIGKYSSVVKFCKVQDVLDNFEEGKAPVCLTR